METESLAPKSPWWISHARWIGPAIFLVAFLFRLVGIGWGLPSPDRAFSYHPDETINWIYSNQIDLAKGDLDPNFYNYGTLYLTLLSVSTKVTDAYSPAVESDNPMAGFLRIGSYLMAGRWISAFAGALLVALVWVAGRRFLGVPACAAATLSAFFAPGLLMHSRFATVDVLATALVFGALTYLVFVATATEEEQPLVLRWLILAGVLIGLSAGTKYSGFLALPSLFWVAWQFLPAQKRGQGLALCGAVPVVAFLLSTPGVLHNFEAFKRDFSYELAHTATGHGLVFSGTPSGFIVHFGNLISAYGAILTLLTPLCLFLLWRKDLKVGIPLVVYFVLMYVAIGRAEVKFVRYVFPLIPVLALGIGAMYEAFSSQKPSLRSVGHVLIFLGIGGFGGGGAADSVSWTTMMTRPDPRDRVAEILKDAESIGVVSDPWFYTPPFYPQVGAPRSVPADQRNQWMLAETRPRVIRATDAAGTPVDFGTVFGEELPQYIVYSSFESEDRERIIEAPRSRLTDGEFAQGANYAAFKKWLLERYQLDHLTGATGPGPHDLMYIQPRVWVWKRKPI